MEAPKPSDYVSMFGVSDNNLTSIQKRMKRVNKTLQ